MRDMQDYSRSRALATVEYGGFQFQVVRQRLNGKPWRKYLCLCYAGRAMSGTFNRGITDPAEAAAYFKHKFEMAFPPDGTLILKDEIDKILREGADL